MAHLPAHAIQPDPVQSIYQQMVAAGVPVASYSSDLYAPVNDTTRAIVDAYRFKRNVTTFISDDPADKGARFYDIPFAYDPWWDARR